MKVKKYKKVAAYSLLASSLLLSSACSNESASSGGKGESKDEISITYRSGGGTNKGLTDWLEKEVIPEFKKSIRVQPLSLLP